jgi:preprotein translocase subunit YajC
MCFSSASLFLLTPLAQAPAASGFNPMSLMPIVIIFGIMYVMMIRPQQRKEKERRAMIDLIKSGDRILFGGGIIGTVSNVKDGTLMVKVADNVKMEVVRGSVTRVFAKGEKAQEEESK